MTRPVEAKLQQIIIDFVNQLCTLVVKGALG